MDQVPGHENLRPLGFSARRGPFLGLLVKNALLTLVTVGFYRFWARTAVRRYLWRHVRFLDDPLEYTGTGGELFLGFLIVIAVLFPVALIYGAIDVVVPPGAVGLRIGLEAGYYLALFALIQIGFYRMWRYRMSRTVWRGVRCGLEGSSWAYLRLAAGWAVVTALTLGLAYPWMRIELWRYQIAHTRLGRDTFAFTGSGRQLLGPWIPVDLALLTAGGALALVYMHAFYPDWIGVTGGAALAARLETIGAVLAVALAILPFVYLWYRVCQARVQISGISFAVTRAHLRLPLPPLLAAAATSGALCLLAAAPALALIYWAVTGTAPPGSPDWLAAMTAGPVLAALPLAIVVIAVWPLIWTAGFGFDAIRIAVATTTLENPHALAHALQAEGDTLRTGEGLADALDIGGF